MLTKVHLRQYEGWKLSLEPEGDKIVLSVQNFACRLNIRFEPRMQIFVEKLR